MRDLVAKYREEMTRPLVSLTHEERGPWNKIWDGGRGNDQRIPYALALADDDPNRDAILEAAAQFEAIAKADSIRH